VFAEVSLKRLTGDEDRAVQIFEQDAQAARVVAVLVRDDDAVELSGVAPDEHEPPHDLPGAHPGVDEDVRPPRRDQNRVAGRAASENSEFHK